MRVYILTAIDTMCNEGTTIFGVFLTIEKARERMLDEIDAYGGEDECDFEFEIEEHEVK